MHERDIFALGASLVSSVPSLPKRAAPISRRLLVGFDTEWRASDRSLLSIQFALRTTKGELHSDIFEAPDERLDPVTLVQCLQVFLTEAGMDPSPYKGRIEIALVSHFAGAELGMFRDPIRDLTIHQIGKAHHAELPGVEDEDAKVVWACSIRDLYAYYKTSLKKVGELVGLPKLEADRTALDRLLTTKPDEYRRYACRDAEIAVVAFEALRAEVRLRWGIDILKVSTLPGLASQIFRRHFLVSRPAPVRSTTISVRRPLKSGWADRPRVVEIYAGPEDRRQMACRSYSGGRVEAFVRGLIIEPVVERDVVSLYPHAAILQPLPNEKTRWQRIKNVADIANAEGFGEFEFRFASKEQYPCLPVVREGITRLTFTRTGRTSCTFSEVRAALGLGADVRVIQAWGFEPAAREREHDVARYMTHFLAEKSRAPKGTLEYETAKLLLNALIGKFGERRRGSRLLHFEAEMRASGIVGAGAAVARSGVLRDTLRMPPGVGGLWAPEWASLILGKARAIMADIVAKGALLVSTDSVIAPKSLVFDGSGLHELRSTGSDLPVQVEGDAVFIARSRLYAVLQRADNVRSGARVLASDGNWVVVRVARHGSAETEVEFAETVLACLDAGRDVAPVRSQKRLLGAEAAVRAANEVNAEVVRDGKTSFKWDGKRRLLDRDANVFTAFTRTEPYLTLGKLEAAQHQRDVRAGKARRRVKVSNGAARRVVDALRSGQTIRAVSRATGVPKSTVGDIRKKFENHGREQKG